MGFVLVLALATLAACSQAHAGYGTRTVMPAPVRTYGGGVASRVEVLPVRDNRYLDAKMGAQARLGNKYDASRLVQESVYNPRRMGVDTGFGMSQRFDVLGQGSDVRFRDQCNCRVNEVCRMARNGRRFCELDSGSRFQSRDRLGGFRRSGMQATDCMYLEYPRECLRSRSRNTVTRYTFSEGLCQRFTSSGITTMCQPQGDANNIFSSLRECQMYCRV